MTTHRALRRSALCSLGAAALLAGAHSVPAAAQVASASPRAAALAGSGTMIIRGARALGLNPALLAAPDRPKLSIALPALALSAASAPLRFGEITPYENKVVPHAVAESWLQRITAAGGLSTTADLAGQLLGVSVGPVAVGIGATGQATLTIPPALAELLLFGNAGRTGEPHDMTFAGGGGRAWGAGVISLGFGHRLPVHITGGAHESFSIGVTGKFVASPYMATMVPPRGHVTADPIGSDITVPIVVFDELRRSGSGATGYGLDLGAAWSSGPLALGVTLHDAVNTFRYRLSSARIYMASALVTEGSTHASTQKSLPLDDASVDDALRERARALVDGARFPTTLRLSGALTPLPWLTVASDIVAHTGSADALTLLPRFSTGLGAEARIVPFLPLRAGVRVANHSTSFHAGLGLHIFALRVDGAIGTTRGSGAGLDGAIGVTVMGGEY